MAIDGEPESVAPPLGRNGNFVRLWTGGAVSGLGSAMTALAYPLLALGVTTSAGLAGLLGLVALAVGTLTRLPAGAVVDRVPLRAVLVASDILRLVTTATLALSVLTGHLALWQLLVVVGVNAVAAVFSEIAHSVALRHVVTASQLPQAFALGEGRGHAISLVGQPVGGLLYGIAPALPLAADLVSFGVSAALSATLTHPLLPSQDAEPRRRVRDELLTGLRFLWREPLLRATLLAAGAYQLVYGGAAFALIASLTTAGASAGSVGGLFAVAAVGGILGALATPALQARLALKTMVVVMGWTATAVFAAFAWVNQPQWAGLLLGSIYFTSAPANAVLLSAQIQRTPGRLQGRVMAASFLLAGLAAPLGPPGSGIALDLVGPDATFLGIAALTALITLAAQVNGALRQPDHPHA